LPSTDALAALRSVLRRELDALGAGGLLAKLACGRCEENPFPLEATRSIKDTVMAALGAGGAAVEERPAGYQEQPINLPLLKALLRDAGDPDYEVMDQYMVGVRIGVGVVLPRTPAVYEARTKWRLPEQEQLPDEHPEEGVTGAWRANYTSAKLLQPQVVRELEGLYQRGLALKLTEQEARDRYGDALVVASLGALQKRVEDDGTVVIRLLYDGTHGVPVNARIKVRDQERFPAAPDLKRQLREQAASGLPTLGLAVDVKDAHRCIAVAPEDWHLQAAQVVPGAPVYLFKRGTFGVASASYWWGRLAAAVGRLLHYTIGEAIPLWVMLLADDFKLEVTGGNYAAGLLSALWVLILLDIPISWEKVRGGTSFTWVGYELNLRSHTLGLSQSRAQWLCDWMDKVCADKQVLMSDFIAALGRASFGFGALEYDRPFLGPLYAFAALHPPGAVRVVPTYVLLLLHYLAGRLRTRRAFPCAVRKQWRAEGPRLDAKAEGSLATVAGWLPTAGPGGEVDTRCSPWFMVELTPVTAPWAYARGGQPFRVIATLEALAVLLCVIAFEPWLSAPSRAGGGTGVGTAPGLGAVARLPTLTDNKGNTFALNRLASSKFPLCAVAMELAAQLERLGLTLDLGWAPREWNAEADALTNGRFAGFAAERRVAVDLRTVQWAILPAMLEAGAKFFNEVKQLKEKRGNSGAAAPHRKKRREEALRVKDPW